MRSVVILVNVIVAVLTLGRYALFSKTTLSKQPIMMLQKHVWVKDPFKVQDRPVDFNETHYAKFIDMVLDFILQLIVLKTIAC